MNLVTIEKIKDELADVLPGRQFGKIFQLSRNEIAINLRLPDSRYLFVSVAPGDPRAYLIRRRLRDLERAATNPSSFVLQLRKQLSGSTLVGIDTVPGERVIKFGFRGESARGEMRSLTLVFQLTGRSANLFLLEPNEMIVDSMRRTNGIGQEVGMSYAPPQRPEVATTATFETAFPINGHASLSEALDADDLRKSEELKFQQMVISARTKIANDIAKRERLLQGLAADLARHGDPERWKKFGDLLLANIATAKRMGKHVNVIDYFDESQTAIEIAIDENESITEAAEKFFRRYTKSRNSRDEIGNRNLIVEAELADLKAKRAQLEDAIWQRDTDGIAEFLESKRQIKPVKRKVKESAVSMFARIFRSSEDFEILVGKKAKDNDQLTFKIARSLDTWMHAADYPGSHVVIRNPNRKEIPHRTLLEAAQLAAFYSQGKAQPKAAVHYTQKKFVNKPKGSAPGLVSLASFKTILVEPKIEAELIR